MQEGQKIHLMGIPSREGQSDVKFYYGYDGYNPDKIEGQEYDFSVESSEHNENSSNSYFGQYPYIYYSK